MDTESRYQRINLRIPKDLHAKIMDAADARSHSMNAEIVQRLENTFGPCLSDPDRFVRQPFNLDAMGEDEVRMAQEIRYLARLSQDRLVNMERGAHATLWSLAEVERLKKSGAWKILLQSLADLSEQSKARQAEWLESHPEEREKLERDRAESAEWEGRIQAIRREQEELHARLKAARDKKHKAQRKLNLRMMELDRDMLAEHVRAVEEESRQEHGGQDE